MRTANDSQTKVRFRRFSVRPRLSIDQDEILSPEEMRELYGAVGKGLDAYVAVDACGTFSQTKREVGLLRMLQAGVIITDYASLMVEILKDNSRPDASAIYGAIDMPWAKLVGQITLPYGK